MRHVWLQECLDRAALLPAALNAVLYAFHPVAAIADADLQTLCMDLFKQPASPVFLDAMFDTVAVVIDMVSTCWTSAVHACWKRLCLRSLTDLEPLCV